MPSKPMELVFPLRGINDGWAYGRQPEGTCPDASNCVPFDSIDSRARGGQRWGISKYYAAQHNGANALQGMTSLALSTIPVAPVTDSFTQANGVLDDTSWYPLEYSFPNLAISATHPRVVSNKLVFDETDGASVGYCGAVHKTAAIAFPHYEVSMDVAWTLDETSSTIGVGFYPRVMTTFPDLPEIVATISPHRAFLFVPTYTMNVHIAGTGGGGEGSLIILVMTPGSGDYLDPAWWATARTLKLVVSGNLFKLYAEDTLLHTAIITTLLTNTAVGIYMNATSFGFESEVTVDNFSFKNVSESGRDYKLIAVSGGDVYTGRPSEILAAATDGTNVVNTTGRVGLQSAFTNVYLCDGVNANYSVWTSADDTVAAWTPDSGTLPVSGANGARYIALYRGRIVLSGLIGDPHNWFMSAAGDPLDWDYGATTSAIMAVAGNNTNAGYCPDIITCLAPYSDDLMFIGGDHTIWQMTGDPADRGRIDNISQQTGIAGPDAFAFDPNGIFYFFGSGAIWRMAAGGIPEPLSKGRMDWTFGNIDLANNTVHLVWDNIQHGLHIFIKPSAEGSTTHYYWDERTDSFWSISFPDAQGPTTVFAFDGDDPNDNAILLGGWDGYIRRVDPSVSDDDGTAISSYILYPPIAAGGSLRNTRLNGITAILDTDSDDVILTAYAEETIQKAIEATTIRFARTLSAGRTSILNRVAGNAIMLKLSNSVDETTWAIESLIANVEVIGRTRKNQL